MVQRARPTTSSPPTPGCWNSRACWHAAGRKAALLCAKCTGGPGTPMGGNIRAPPGRRMPSGRRCMPAQSPISTSTSSAARGAVTNCVRNQMGGVAGFTHGPRLRLPRLRRRRAGEKAAFNARSLKRSGALRVAPTRPTRGSDQSFWGVGLSSLQVLSLLAWYDPDHLPNKRTRAAVAHRAGHYRGICSSAILARDTELHVGWCWPSPRPRSCRSISHKPPRTSRRTARVTGDRSNIE